MQHRHQKLSFEQTIRTKLKSLSFQDPDKVADGLSYIWLEAHKWSRIAGAIGKEEKAVRTTLKLIATRRHAIVHEADMDPITQATVLMSKAECDNASAFLLDIGTAICRLVN